MDLDPDPYPPGSGFVFSQADRSGYGSTLLVAWYLDKKKKKIDKRNKYNYICIQFNNIKGTKQITNYKEYKTRKVVR